MPPAPFSPVPLKRSIRASIRWASKESPAAAPAAFQRALASASSPGATSGPGDLVGEELTPDAAVVVLVPAKVPLAVHPGPPHALGLAASFGGPQPGRGVGELLLGRPLPDQVQQGLGCLGYLRRRRDHHPELVGGELGLVERLGQPGVRGRPLGRGQTPLGLGGRGARERAQPLLGRAVAPLGERARLDHPGREQRHPRGGRPLDLGEGGHDAAGLVPRDRAGLGPTHQFLEVAEECIDLVAECRVADPESPDPEPS